MLGTPNVSRVPYKIKAVKSTDDLVGLWSNAFFLQTFCHEPGQSHTITI
jgi:hypothetical protein